MLKIWKSVNKVLQMIENGIALSMLLSATGVLLVNVILRYFFGSGFIWAEEYIRYSLIIGAFFGGAIAMRNKSHVAMSMLVDLVKAGRAKKIYLAVLNALTFALCAYIVYLGIKQIQFLMEMDQRSPALGVPMYIPYVSIPVGFAFMAIHCVENAVNEIRPVKEGQN